MGFWGFGGIGNMLIKINYKLGIHDLCYIQELVEIDFGIKDLS